MVTPERDVLVAMIRDHREFMEKSGRDLGGYVERYGEAGRDNYIADLSELARMTIYLDLLLRRELNQKEEK